MDLLDALAKRCGVFISDLPDCDWLPGMRELLKQENHPLQEWSQALRYLAKRQVVFGSTDEIAAYLSELESETASKQ